MTTASDTLAHELGFASAHEMQVYFEHADAARDSSAPDAAYDAEDAALASSSTARELGLLAMSKSLGSDVEVVTQELRLLRGRPSQHGADGQVLANDSNFIEILRYHPEWLGVLALNEFDGNVLKLRPPPYAAQYAGHDGLGAWTDADTTYTSAWLQQRYAGMQVYRSMLEGAIEATARLRKFHPVRRRLEALRHDGKARLDTWLTDYLGTPDSAYARAVGPKVLVSLVARVFSPGCKVDTVPILEGSQGAKKSTVWRTLALEDEWFTDTVLNLGDKDSYQALRGRWIIEFGELTGVLRSGRSRTTELTKAFLSSSVDTYRPSYGRRTQSYPRQCVFVATTNEDEYLHDPSGNRRYWPIATSDIRLDLLARDRDQLLAEAVQRYRNGEPWWLAESEEASAVAEQSARLEDDPWQVGVEEYLRVETHDVTTIDVLVCGLHVEESRATLADQKRVGSILRKLGYAPHGSQRPRRWRLAT